MRPKIQKHRELKLAGRIIPRLGIIRLQTGVECFVTRGRSLYIMYGGGATYYVDIF
jgi:hypothetical protein